MRFKFSTIVRRRELFLKPRDLATRGLLRESLRFAIALRENTSPASSPETLFLRGDGNLSSQLRVNLMTIILQSRNPRNSKFLIPLLLP